MIQDLIRQTWAVFYNVRYVSDLLRSMGFSYQKAKFISSHLNEEKRKVWRKKTWQEIKRLAAQKKACILFGDECSFAQ